MPDVYRAAVSLLVPPRCAICATPCAAVDTICVACESRLAAATPGIENLAGIPVVWAAPYDGVARELVAALKFAGRIALAERAADAIAAALPADLGAEAVVAVPAAPFRCRRRGFDPADEIAVRVADRLGLPLEPTLKRKSGPRQVGKRRRERLGSPPTVWAAQPLTCPALLVDDVLTTGATIAASASALRSTGAADLTAAVFARTLGGGTIWS